MNDTIVTVVGNVVDAPRRNNTQNGTVTNFRMASNARRYDASREEFVDSGTLWIDVECWGNLSSNVSASISKGDPVIVHGAMTTHSWESEAGPRSKPQIKAFSVGPNLQKGRALFTRDKFARTGEVVPPTPETTEDHGFPGADDESRVERDYLGAEDALQQMTEASPEPVHA
ncbi:single-stranded DNA-binding protein [Blastococcus sp. LR1]|uniref:single-stranded DNA-binding protein n=1 Tax=Blastococcus sp. LR1 TaxID=2877000 RepID=UPI001CCD36A6|nr:single-stranded DNA-binding protein [Blastococcus sp. LR1]MCA0144056.1 single-stranded DNA-binding protein [Blastococcus sp. LR1]